MAGRQVVGWYDGHPIFAPSSGTPRQPAGMKASSDDSGRIRVAIARLGAIDADNDVSMPGSFPVGKETPMSAYGHTIWTGALPVGRGVIKEQGGWAIFEGEFFLDTPHGLATYQTVKRLADLQEWSYGLNAYDTSYGTQEGRTVRFIHKQDLFEVSPVLKGANGGTHVQEIRGLDPTQLGYATVVRDHAAALASGMKLARTHERKVVLGARRRLIGYHPVDGSPVYVAA